MAHTPKLPRRPEDAHRPFGKAVDARDPDALAALYEPEPRLVPQPRRVVEGREALREGTSRYVIDHPLGAV